jgi:hypothetical protein
MTDDHSEQHGAEIIQFGRRPIPPRACVVENRTHVRMFLTDMLDELGFIAREADTADIRTVLREFRPDLIVLGPLGTGLEVQALLRTLQAQTYGGTVMLFGGRSSEALISSHEFGEQAGLTMLPPLGTPFRARELNANLDRFLPIRPPPPLPVDVDEALCNGWLELWYQSKIDPQSLVPRGAEALVRVRHPTWGVVPPAYFVPAANDPYLHALSHFVIARALADSIQFAATDNPVNISVPLPLLALEDLQFIDRMMEHFPEKARHNGFLIALDCVDLVNDYALVRRIGAQLALRNIGMAVNDIDVAPTTGSSRPAARKLSRSRAIAAPSRWLKAWRHNRIFSSFAISASTCFKAACLPSRWRRANSNGLCSPGITLRWPNGLCHLR